VSCLRSIVTLESWLMKQIISDLIDGKDLTANQASAAMVNILSGKCNDSEIASFITLLRAKGETRVELTALVQTMWANMPDFGLVDNSDTIDTCGTGGSAFKTFNISTGVSFILTALGVKVAKHGNRAASSKSGAADVLEELGYNINLEAKKCADLFNETGFAFLLAPSYHPGMRFAKQARSDLGVRTTFNFLGPLANPFKAPIRLHGVSDHDMVERYILTLKDLGVEKAIVFCGENMIDEILISSLTIGKRLVNGVISDFTFDPVESGFSPTSDDEIAGGDPKENAEILRDIFAGKPGPPRDVVVANTSVAYSLAKDIDIASAKLEIESVLDNKTVQRAFDKIVERSNNI
jgi:anthranilate phosphoribosyltransferase